MKPLKVFVSNRMVLFESILLNKHYHNQNRLLSTKHCNVTRLSAQFMNCTLLGVEVYDFDF